MGFFLDLVTVLIIAGVVWQSYRRGFVHTVIVLVGYILALLAAISLSTPVGTWIYGHLLQGALTSWVRHAISSQGLSDATGGLAQAIQSLAPGVDVSALLRAGATQAQDAVITSVVQPIGLSIGRGIAFIVLFILFAAAVRILAHFSISLSHVPVLGFINRIGGAVLGFFKALLILFVLCTLLAALLPALSYTSWPLNENAISQSHIFRIIYEANPLQTILLNNK